MFSRHKSNKPSKGSSNTKGEHVIRNAKHATAASAESAKNAAISKNTDALQDGKNPLNRRHRRSLLPNFGRRLKRSHSSRSSDGNKSQLSLPEAPNTQPIDEPIRRSFSDGSAAAAAVLDAVAASSMVAEKKATAASFRHHEVADSDGANSAANQNQIKSNEAQAPSSGIFRGLFSGAEIVEVSSASSDMTPTNADAVETETDAKFVDEPMAVSTRDSDVENKETSQHENDAKQSSLEPTQQKDSETFIPESSTDDSSLNTIKNSESWPQRAPRPELPQAVPFPLVVVDHTKSSESLNTMPSTSSFTKIQKEQKSTLPTRSFIQPDIRRASSMQHEALSFVGGHVYKVKPGQSTIADPASGKPMRSLIRPVRKTTSTEQPESNKLSDSDKQSVKPLPEGLNFAAAVSHSISSPKLTRPTTKSMSPTSDIKDSVDVVRNADGVVISQGGVGGITDDYSDGIMRAKDTHPLRVAASGPQSCRSDIRTIFRPAPPALRTSLRSLVDISQSTLAASERTTSTDADFAEITRTTEIAKASAKSPTASEPIERDQTTGHHHQSFAMFQQMDAQTRAQDDVPTDFERMLEERERDSTDRSETDTPTVLPFDKHEPYGDNLGPEENTLDDVGMQTKQDLLVLTGDELSSDGMVDKEEEEEASGGIEEDDADVPHEWAEHASVLRSLRAAGSATPSSSDTRKDKKKSWWMSFSCCSGRR